MIQKSKLSQRTIFLEEFFYLSYTDQGKYYLLRKLVIWDFIISSLFSVGILWNREGGIKERISGEQPNAKDKGRKIFWFDVNLLFENHKMHIGFPLVADIWQPQFEKSCSDYCVPNACVLIKKLVKE